MPEPTLRAVMTMAISAVTRCRAGRSRSGRCSTISRHSVSTWTRCSNGWSEGVDKFKVAWEELQPEWMQPWRRTGQQMRQAEFKSQNPLRSPVDHPTAARGGSVRWSYSVLPVICPGRGSAGV